MAAAKTATTLETRSSRAPSQGLPSISYRLSDGYFMDVGWTNQPNKALAHPVVLMRAMFAHPVISPWFQKRDRDVAGQYPDGTTAYYARPDGTGTVFYPNGRKAIVVERGGVARYRTRIWVYGPGEVDKDGLTRPAQLCALFDSLGNGVVYDQAMNKRLVYNQVEGTQWDTFNGLPVHWKWHDLKYSGTESLMNEDDDENSLVSDLRPVPESHAALARAADPGARTSREESIRFRGLEETSESNTAVSLRSNPPEAVDSRSHLLEKVMAERYIDTSKILPRRVSPLKPIVLRLNTYITLRVWQQSDITLSFFAGCRHTQLKIGVLYNPFDKVKVMEVTNASPERVFCYFESAPPRTRSMLRLRKMLRKVRKTSFPS